MCRLMQGIAELSALLQLALQTQGMEVKNFLIEEQ